MVLMTSWAIPLRHSSMWQAARGQTKKSQQIFSNRRFYKAEILPEHELVNKRKQVSKFSAALKSPTSYYICIKEKKHSHFMTRHFKTLINSSLKAGIWGSHFNKGRLILTNNVIHVLCQLQNSIQKMILGQQPDKMMSAALSLHGTYSMDD